MSPTDLQRFEKAVLERGDIPAALEELASVPSDHAQAAAIESRIQAAALRALVEEAKKA